MVTRRPIILGIVGDSAAGKTTITRGLMNVLGADSVTHVCTDDYHKHDRHERSALGITPLRPEHNYLDVLEQHMERLYAGQAILKPVYDHKTGSLVRPEYVVPKQYVIVEGLLGFHSPLLRQFYDVKVYLDPPEDLRRLWKVHRDTTKRGYTAPQVQAELARRERDSQECIRPQREFADIVVRFSPPAGLTPEQAGGDLDVQLVLRPTIPHPDLTYLVEAEQPGVQLLLGRDSGRPVDFLRIDGDVGAHHAARLERAIWQHLPDLRPVSDDLFGAYVDRGETRHSPPLALTQLLVAYHLLRKHSDLTQQPAAAPVSALGRIESLRAKP